MTAAQQTFELENGVRQIDDRDEIYAYDAAGQKEVLAQKPWRDNPHYFEHVRISALALLKMTIHARSGGAIEVMGLMQGKVIGRSFIVMDSFPLPVEGTETRVNAQAEAYEYMVAYQSLLREVGREDNVVGWYHSHPGYGCWLSGIDVGTQLQNQQYQDPWLAVVIDPNRTISAGKVEIGAFRTFPANYKPSEAPESEYQTIPLAKIEDFGAHANAYYALEISHFKSALDAAILDSLWRKYWVATLSQSPILTNRVYASQQMLDLSEKIAKAQRAVGNSRMPSAKEHEPLERVVRDSSKITSEEIQNLISQMIKHQLYNRPLRSRHGGMESA